MYNRKHARPILQAYTYKQPIARYITAVGPPDYTIRNLSLVLAQTIRRKQRIPGLPIIEHLLTVTWQGSHVPLPLPQTTDSQLTSSRTQTRTAEAVPRVRNTQP